MALEEKYRSSGSAAIDIFAVKNNTAQPLEKPEHLPEAPAAPAKKVKYKLAISPFAVIGTAVAVVLLLLVIFSYVSMFEVQNEIGSLKSAQNEFSVQQEKLRSDYESSIDLSVIEERALALGMHQATSDQIHYVQIGEGDTTQVYSAPEDRNIFEQIYDAFYGVFSDVGEYFS